MDARLKSTTFCGQRYTRKQIARILDVVETFPLLSRSELALTVCEQLRLQTPSCRCGRACWPTWCA